MMTNFIKPWNDKAENVLRQLSISGRAYIHDPKFARKFGQKYKTILDDGLLDIATTRYSKREDKILFVTPPNIAVIPKPGQRGVRFHFKRYRFL